MCRMSYSILYFHLSSLQWNYSTVHGRSSNDPIPISMAIVTEETCIPFWRKLGNPAERFVVNIVKPKPYTVTISPFKVVQQTPNKIASYICSFPVDQKKWYIHFIFKNLLKLCSVDNCACKMKVSKTFQVASLKDQFFTHRIAWAKEAR